MTGGQRSVIRDAGGASADSVGQLDLGKEPWILSKGFRKAVLVALPGTYFDLRL